MNVETKLPDIGKISPDFFDEVIYPRLGAKRDDVLVGPSHGVDVGIIRIGDGRVMAVTTDPIYVVPQYGWEGGKGFHDRAAGKGDVPQIRSADPRKDNVQGYPIRTGEGGFCHILKAEATQGAVGHGGRDTAQALGKKKTRDRNVEGDSFHPDWLPGSKVETLSGFQEPVRAMGRTALRGEATSAR